jgi:hypothetical protein
MDLGVPDHAIWALGEMVLQKKGLMKDILPTLTTGLMRLMSTDDQPHALWENIVVTLGRIAYLYPELIVENHPQSEFLIGFSLSLVACRDQEEQRSGTLPLQNIIGDSIVNITDDCIGDSIATVSFKSLLQRPFTSLWILIFCSLRRFPQNTSTAAFSSSQMLSICSRELFVLGWNVTRVSSAVCRSSASVSERKRDRME